MGHLNSLKPSEKKRTPITLIKAEPAALRGGKVAVNRSSVGHARSLNYARQRARTAKIFRRAAGMCGRVKQGG